MKFDKKNKYIFFKKNLKKKGINLKVLQKEYLEIQI